MPDADAAALLARVQSFADTRIAPAAAGWSMGASPDPALYREAAGLGLFGVEVPVAQGGAGLGYTLKARICAILAAADFGFAMSVVNTHNVALRLVQSAAQSVQDAHLAGLLSGAVSACTALTEPGAGSDFGAVQTRAVPQGDGWLLTGEKTWIVNARHAGLAIVFAQCGTAEQTPANGAGIGAFAVDLTAPGVTRYAIDAAFSQTSTGTGGFRLKDVRLGPDALLLPPGTAFKSILTEINGARTYVAAMCCAMLETALDQAARYGEVRKTFGKPLSAHQGWRLHLAQARGDLSAAQALTDRAIARVAAGEDAQLAAAEAKIQAVEASQRHLPALLHAMGAEGLRAEHCFTRHLAAAQVAGLTDGSTTMLRERVLRLTRPAPDPTPNPEPAPKSKD